MRSRMDILQRPDAHPRVDLRRLDVRVPQHRLNEPHVGPVLQHLRRRRVPEQVATTDVAQPRRSHAIAHHLRHPVRTTDFKYNQRLNITANRRTVTPSIAVNVARAAWAATHTTR